MKLKIQCFIISWHGQHENAAVIAASIGSAADCITVVFSDTDDDFPRANAFLIRRPNNLMWGDKFAACLEHFDGDIMLVIHADCHCEDWAELVMACRRNFNTVPDMGLWAPKIAGTPWRLDTVAINDFDDELTFVAQTDGIVFAISKEISNRVKSLQYDDNVYGWGIDWALVATCYDRGRRVMINRKIPVLHPVGSGYPTLEARRQMDEFLKQLTPSETSIVTVLNSYCFDRQSRNVVHLT